MIEEQYKKGKVSKIQFEPKKGERNFLYCNKSDKRSPFLSDEELQKFEKIKPILKILFTKIIEREINNYLVSLNEKIR